MRIAPSVGLVQDLLYHYSFGFDTVTSQLLTVPPYVLASKTSQHRSDYHQLTAFPSHCRPYLFHVLRPHEIALPICFFRPRTCPSRLRNQRCRRQHWSQVLRDVPRGSRSVSQRTNGADLVLISSRVVHWDHMYPTLTGSYRIGNNCIGHYKRGIGLGMTVMFGNIGGVIASNVYRIQDAPRYTRGRESILIIGSISER